MRTHQTIAAKAVAWRGVPPYSMVRLPAPLIQRDGENDRARVPLEGCPHL